MCQQAVPALIMRPSLEAHVCAHPTPCTERQAPGMRPEQKPSSWNLGRGPQREPIDSAHAQMTSTRGTLAFSAGDECTATEDPAQKLRTAHECVPRSAALKLSRAIPQVPTT